MPVQRIHHVSASRGLRSEVARLRGELAFVRGTLRQMSDQFAVVPITATGWSDLGVAGTHRSARSGLGSRN